VWLYTLIPAAGGRALMDMCKLQPPQSAGEEEDGRARKRKESLFSPLIFRKNETDPRLLKTNLCSIINAYFYLQGKNNGLARL
jgi:hypothetical protein